MPTDSLKSALLFLLVIVSIVSIAVGLVKLSGAFSSTDHSIRLNGTDARVRYVEADTIICVTNLRKVLFETELSSEKYILEDENSYNNLCGGE